MKSTPHSPTCWVISDGRRGIENQALGLAEALARIAPLNIEKKRVLNRSLFKGLPPRAQSLIKSKPTDFEFSDPYPEIAIGCGRQAIAPLLALKTKGHFIIYVQDPRIDPKSFDLVITPKHDDIHGPNIIPMIGAPNRITDEGLQAAQTEFKSQLARFPKPCICVLIGGNSKTHQLSKDNVLEHIDRLTALNASKYSLFITTSRRTPKFARDLYQKFGIDHENVWVWDGNEPNPYFAFLAQADAILVSKDSTNMLTEACTSGKPVYTLNMSGKDGKFARLYQDLAAYGVKPFTGRLDMSLRPAFNETQRVAKQVVKAMQKRR